MRSDKRDAGALRRGAAALASLALLGALAACGTPQEAPPTAAAPTPTPSATATPTPQPQPVGFAPVSMAIPSLGVTAPLQPEVPDANNVLGVPSDPRRLGYRAAGAMAEASTGTLLTYGHVVNKGYGKGALYTLKNLAVGATVVVTGAQGESATYVVTANERYQRDAMPRTELLATTGPHRLAVYTCDGSPDSTGHRTQRVVVWAVPA